MGRHTGQVVLVTGAASGIGRSTARRVEAEGGAVVAFDLSGDALAWTDDHENIAPFEGDVTEPGDNAAAVDLAVRSFGRLDGSVLNAGMPMAGDLIDLPIEKFDQTLDVNVRGVVLGVRAALPALRESGSGSIVATASTSGLGGDPGLWAYNAAKAAVINYVRAAAIDLAPQGIRVNAVCPGPTVSGMTQQLRADRQRAARLARRIPMQRFGESAELASVISFLLSDDASFVTGAAIPVDGGVSASAGHFDPGETR